MIDTSYKKYDRFIILFWILLYFVFFMQYIPQASLIEAILFPLCILGPAYPITTYLSKNLLQRAMKTKKMKVFVFQFVLFSLILSCIIFASIHLFFYLETSGYFPPSELFSESGVSAYDFPVANAGAVLINLSICGLRFYEENLKLQRTLVESQFQILQEQINPHFMFNVLNHIHILMQKDVDLASSLLIKYSDILRYQLYNGKRQYISIDKEVQFLKNFIDIEKIRWGNELSVNCSWKIEDRNKECPPLLLITFIENAFKHVVRSTSEKGYINISFQQAGDTIHLDVENSKSAMQARSEKDSGLGLENIKKRLNILYANKYKLLIDETETVYHSKLTITI